MRHRFSPLMLLLPFIAGCCCCGMGGSTQVAPEELEKVTGVQTEGLGEVTISAGEEPYGIEAEGLTTSELDGSTLKMTLLGEQSAKLPQVSTVTVNGANDVTINGVDVEAFTAKLIADLGSLTANGTANNLDVEISNTVTGGEIDLSGLTAENATVNITGGGNNKVRLNVTGTLTVSGSGEGEVILTGGAEVTEDVTGDITVTAEDGDTPPEDEPAEGEAPAEVDETGGDSGSEEDA